MFKIFEPFWDKQIGATGLTLASIHWWVGLFVIAGVIILFSTFYFLFVWLFGRIAISKEDEEALKNYRNLSKEEKKVAKKAAHGPAKRLLIWKTMRAWLIPVVCFFTLVGFAGSSILYTSWGAIVTTLSGSKVVEVDTETSRRAAQEANQNVITIEEEGIVLLKNENNCLPLNIDQDNKVNIFGAGAFGMMFGNGGSGAFQTNKDRTNTAGGTKRFATKFEAAMEEEGFEFNKNLWNLTKNYFNGSKVSVAESNYVIDCGVNTYNYAEICNTLIPYEHEAPVSAYNTPFNELGGATALEEAKEFSDTAIFCITRYGTESQDMNTSEMQLKQNEKDIIAMLEENFEKVIILFNVPVCIEAEFLNDEGIDAALFVGHPGLTGATAIAEVLSGKVNPSGHLVDTWPYDCKSAPSYQSFGNDTTKSYSGGSQSGNFVNFVEGIYVGYRYYVTRAMEDPDFNYDDYVLYSFGHGLSYTTFDKYIYDIIHDEEAQTIKIQVGVKNTGSVAGKEVLQLYTNAPYYPGNGIEKSYYSLTAFKKTNLLQPGEEKVYEMEISYRDQASWSKADECYVLEEGTYEISLRDNVWDLAETNETESKGTTYTYEIGENIYFRTSYETGHEYRNLFQAEEYGPIENEPIVYVSRDDFAGTFPVSNDIKRNASSTLCPGGKSAGNFTFEDNQIEGDIPTMSANNGTKFKDLKNADWDDPRWEDLLDNLSLTDMQNLVDNGGFKTSAIASIDKGETKDYDGPAAAFHSGTGHTSEVILACSWDPNVALLMGESVGKEGAARGLTGWYAPGINIHRSPYGGRNFEYYSEDPLISGQMAGYTAQGLLEYGVYSYAKHFALNEQERNRDGLYCWASEQSIREIYARGFEIYTNLGGLGIMTSFNRVGSWWAGANENLCWELLREEWGFHGVVVTDYCSNSVMLVSIGLRGGNDLWLNKNGSYPASNAYNQAPHDVTILLRRACKNILYACAHSNNAWEDEDFHAVGIEEVVRASDRS